MPKPTINPKSALTALRAAIQRAFTTLRALPDADAAFRRAGHQWDVIQNPAEAYGSAAPTMRIIPNAHDIAEMEIVLDWMSWLRRNRGEEEFRRLALFGKGVEIWRLAEMEGKSQPTVRSRIDQTLDRILLQCGFNSANPPIIDEPDLLPSVGRAYREPSTGAAPSPIGGSKVYVSGLGWFKNGRRWNTSLDQAEQQLRKSAR